MLIFNDFIFKLRFDDFQEPAQISIAFATTVIDNLKVTDSIFVFVSFHIERLLMCRDQF